MPGFGRDRLGRKWDAVRLVLAQRRAAGRRGKREPRSDRSRASALHRDDHGAGRPSKPRVTRSTHRAPARPGCPLRRLVRLLHVLTAGDRSTFGGSDPLLGDLDHARAPDSPAAPETSPPALPWATVLGGDVLGRVGNRERLQKAPTALAELLAAEGSEAERSSRKVLPKAGPTRAGRHDFREHPVAVPHVQQAEGRHDDAGVPRAHAGDRRRPGGCR